MAERDGFEIRFPNVRQKPLQFYRQFGPSGSIATQEECTSAGGRFIPIKYGWMTHVDFYDSPKP